MINPQEIIRHKRYREQALAIGVRIVRTRTKRLKHTTQVTKPLEGVPASGRLSTW